MKLTVDVYESVTGRIKLGKVGSDCGVKGYRITMKHLGTTELDIAETQAPSVCKTCNGTKRVTDTSGHTKGKIGDYSIRRCPDCIDFTQAPSADRYEMYRNNPYYPFESESQWLEYDNQLINKTREKDQSPSATVDEIVNKHLSKVVEFLQQVGILEEITEESTDDDKMYDGDIRYHIYSAIENAIGEYSHSQQPTVDDPYMKNFGVSSQQPTVDVDLVESICNFVNENYAYIADERGSKMPLELFLQEALIGTYTEKELLRNRISELESENVRLIKIMDGR